MKKILTSTCILLAAVMIAPAMAQEGSIGRLDRQRDRVDGQTGRYVDRNAERMVRNIDGTHRRFGSQGRRDNRRIDRGRDHWRGQRSARLANPWGYRGNHKYFRYGNRYKRHSYSRFNNRYNRHFYSKYKNRHRNHTYYRYNHGHYRHMKNW